MSEFEDNLWVKVVREHGDELARIERTDQPRRVTRPRLLAGTTVGLAAIAVAAALLLGASTSPPAFAITRNHDGTVTVNLRKLAGIAGANAKLAAMGVRAQIAAPTKHAPKLMCPDGAVPTVTFDPASIRKRQEIVIAPGETGARDAAAIKGLLSRSNAASGSTGSGSTGTGAIAGGGNHVVRLHSDNGKIRMYSGESNHVVRMYCP